MTFPSHPHPSNNPPLSRDLSAPKTVVHNPDLPNETRASLLRYLAEMGKKMSMSGSVSLETIQSEKERQNE